MHTIRGDPPHPRPQSLGVWVVLLVLSSSCIAFASRPYREDAAHAQIRSAAQIRQLTQQVASRVNSMSRQLMQSAVCPEGCSPGYCQQDATSGALRCAKCENNLIVAKLEGWCVCPAGKYSVYGAASCTDCPKGSWCPGGRYSIADPPKKEDCPDMMTTVGLRSTSSRSCVNMPGTSYAITADGIPSATMCPVNTYGPGLKKQRACVPCPTGLTTNNVTGSRAATSCVVPPGYYLKGPGQVAPCPKGEWKAGIGADGNCTRCAMGVTTEGTAATSESECSILVPGFYARAMTGRIITSVVICPQKYYCAGGVPIAPFDPAQPSWLSPVDPTIKACPGGLWTEGVGARVLEQCLVPPGYKAAGNTVVPCGDNEWRANWKTAAEASSCNSCGQGVQMVKTDSITSYNPITNNETQIAVATSSDDCYIQAGQGLMFASLNQSWRAVNCDDNNYGVANASYGLSPQPCRPCPQNMITSKDKTNYPRSSRWYVQNDDGTGGFVSPYACVNRAGYGYNGRISQKCDKGYFNDKDTYSTCRSCGYGLTTRGPGAGIKAADCGIQPGYGYEYGDFYNKTLKACPIGTYADEIRYDRTSACTACPNGTTTSVEGADSLSDCDKCDGGWGGPNCATQCGGVGDQASYGPPGRTYGSPCISCNNILTSYSYNWGTSNDVWSAPVIARIGADNAVDCLAAYTQLSDGAFYVPVPAGVPSNNVTSNVTTFAACVDLCTSGCALVTYNYKTLDCYTLFLRPSTYEGDPFIAFKNFAAGSTGASSVKDNSTTAARTARSASTVRGKVASDEGDASNYAWWQSPDALLIGTQTLAPGAATFDRYQQCLEACDYDRTCAGVTVQQTIDSDKSDNPIGNTGYNNEGPKSCMLVRGNTNPGTNQRSVIKSETRNVYIPTWTKVCREMPPDVIHGRWPTSCAGMPTGGACVAECDCTPDECYSRDGCPVTICQGDGNWGPFNPPECILAIPAQPQAVSCPAPIREGLWYDPARWNRRRQLLDQTQQEAATANLLRMRHLAHAGRPSLRGQLPAAATGRQLLWDPWSEPAVEFEPFVCRVTSMCSAPEYMQLEFTNPNFAMLLDPEQGPGSMNSFGQLMYDSGVCDQTTNTWFTGIAAQSFVRDSPTEKRKWEQLPKSAYESYAWGFLQTHDLPGPGPANVPEDYGMGSFQGFQLMIVGTVGTDHPCQAACSVTAIDLALFEADDALEPKLSEYTDGNGNQAFKPYWEARIKLPLDKTFTWHGNETAVLITDILPEQGPLWVPPVTRNWWARFRLVVPFNGTDGSGLARCYAYIALRDSQRNASLPAARWQEPGGYNTTCGPADSTYIPPIPEQTVNSCTNGGAPNMTTLDACNAITSTNTCAAKKYGPDTPRSCPFGGQDILFSFFGYNAVYFGGGGAP